MTTTIEHVREKQLGRVRREIGRSGPLNWEGARLAMFGGHYDRRDARFHNETLTGWIAEGKLNLVELANGDSLIDL